MTITINGTGSITGLTAGGLPDGSITSDDIASGAVTAAKLAAGAGGKILQVVSTTKTDTFSTSSTTLVDVTGLSASITPLSASSKILIIVGMMVGGNWWNAFVKISLVRGSTEICQSTGGTNNATAIPIHYAGNSTDTADMVSSQSITFLDSPSTTSATTYKIQGTSLAVNRRWGGTGVGGTSTITLMEVAA